MSALCGQFCAVGTTSDGSVVAIPLRCNSWRCPSCAPRLKHRLMTRLEGQAIHRFMTLTCNPSLFPDAEAAYRTMNKRIPDLFKRIRRYRPKERMEYFIVWEWTKAGWPHAHLLLRGPYLPKSWLSRNWQELTGAPIVDIRKVTGTDAATAYLAKYLTKSLEIPKGFRRYRFSRHFLAPVVKASAADKYGVTSWRIEPGSLIDFIHQYSRLGWFVGAINNWTAAIAQRAPPAILLNYESDPRNQRRSPAAQGA